MHRGVETGLADVHAILSAHDWVAAYKRGFQRLDEQPTAEDLTKDLASSSTAVRVAAAALLCLRDDAAAREQVKRLLDAGDVTARRTASELVLGEEALGAELADRHSYASALAAEKRVRELAEKIRHGGLREQWQATQDLVGLGRPALWGIQQLVRDEDTAVALSAACAQEQILLTRTEWQDRNRCALERSVSFEPKWRSLREWVALVSRLSGLQAEWRIEPGFIEEKREFALGVRDWPLSAVCHLLCLHYDNLDYATLEGRIVFGVRANWDGDRDWLIDVRDLEASGFRPEWPRLVLDHAFPSQEHLILTPDMLLFSIGYVQGFLHVDVKTNTGTPLGLWGLNPIIDYLNHLRWKRHLAYPRKLDRWQEDERP